MRATDRQAAGARTRRWSRRATRPASAIKTASQVNERPPSEGAPLPETPPGAPGVAGDPSPPAEAREWEVSGRATVDEARVTGLTVIPPRSECPGAVKWSAL